MKRLLIALITVIPVLLFSQTGKTGRPLYDKKSIGEIRLTLPAKTG
ncbi:MAG: hypothetical protein IPL27_27970 [Lewinellaceae bacterium]|nr:hypothetical protein [Lewinellaceae bacterium]